MTSKRPRARKHIWYNHCYNDLTTPTPVITIGFGTDSGILTVRAVLCSLELKAHNVVAYVGHKLACCDTGNHFVVP